MLKSSNPKKARSKRSLTDITNTPILGEDVPDKALLNNAESYYYLLHSSPEKVTEDIERVIMGDPNLIVPYLKNFSNKRRASHEDFIIRNSSSSDFKYYFKSFINRRWKEKEELILKSNKGLAYAQLLLGLK